MGAELVKKLIKAKILNQAYFLKSLSKSRKQDFRIVAEELIKSTSSIDNLSGRIDDFRPVLLGIEGLAAKKYFDCLTKILPFVQRDRNQKTE